MTEHTPTGAHPLRDPVHRELEDTLLRETIGDSAGSSRVEDVETLRRGAMVGRYVVLEHIGAGGMGVVYAAYDPDLDRRVALKVLRAAVDGGKGDQARARLLREGQAMAKVRHPNVIAVHDVGTHERRVFIAMEFIDGGTLSQWLAERRRTWLEVLEVFRAAGEGLAAAHRRGMIHRDFKPDNVLIGKDGRICVVDFGLARRDSLAVAADEVVTREGVAVEDSGPRIGSFESRADGLSLSITRTGMLLGTPAYMAPEQHLGLVPTAAADQFAFCVALYEAMYGERPFGGDSPTELLVNVTEGEVRPAPSQSRVPAWIRRVLLRGLKRRPRERWPDMEALLGALERSRGGRRRRWLMAGVTAVGVGGVGMGAWTATHGSGSECFAAAAEWDGLWDEESKARYAAAFVATDKPFAEQTWHAVARDGDAYVERWVEQRIASCTATHGRGEQSPEVLALRNACLDAGRARFAALAELFADADEEVVIGAVDAIQSLPPLTECAPDAVRRAEARLPLDPVRRSAAGRLRRTLERVGTLVQAHRLEAARELVTEALDRAQALGMPSLESEALLVRAKLEEAEARMEQARASTHAALIAAETAGDERLAAAAWVELLWIDGYHLARYRAGHDAADHARALLLRLPAERSLAVLLENRLGDLLYAEGRYAEALERHETTLELRERMGGRHDPLRAEALTGMAICELELRLHDQALAHFQEAMRVYRAAYGDGHPKIAAALTNLGTAYDFRGDYEAALGFHEQALEVAEAAHGPAHPKVALVVNNYAGILLALGRLEEGRMAFERAGDIWRHHYGDAHPDVAMVLYNLGQIAWHQGDRARAQKLHERAWRMRQEVLGQAHPEVAVSLIELAEIARQAGELVVARERLLQALHIHEEAFGPRSDEVIEVRTMLQDLPSPAADEPRASP
ncbi:MAG: tetratricopeptide repeat protein [Myxococcota bacterium]